MLLKGGKILENGKLVQKDVLIKDGLIFKIGNKLESENVIDLEGKLVSPGFIDVHVHLREPGVSHKETIKTGTQAAARGGYTRVCPMPNVKPTPHSLENLQKQLEIIKRDAVIKVTPYASITTGLRGAELSDFDNLKSQVTAFTDDGVGVQSEQVMCKAMKKAKEVNTMIVAHCEDEQYIVSDNAKAEYSQVERDINMAGKIGCSYHVCHISTKESIQFVRAGKKRGYDISCEVSPHHLLLTNDQVNGNTNFKMNPPLRQKEDVRACVQGLLDGTIEMIATDHAPHTEQEKSQDFEKAPYGIVGIETAFPLLYTHFVKNGIFNLNQLIYWMTEAPAKRFGFESGITEGKPADITVIDLEKKETIDKNNFLSLGKNTPFDGWKVQGIPVLTIVDGNIVYKHEQ